MYLFQCKRVKMEVSTLYKTITLREFITCIPSKCSLYQNPPHPYLKMKSVVENDSVFVWKWRQRDSPCDLLWFEYSQYTQVCIQIVWIRYIYRKHVLCLWNFLMPGTTNLSRFWRTKSFAKWTLRGITVKYYFNSGGIEIKLVELFWNCFEWYCRVRKFPIQELCSFVHGHEH